MSEEDDILLFRETVLRSAKSLDHFVEIGDRGVRLFERLVIAMERAVEIADKQAGQDWRLGSPMSPEGGDDDEPLPSSIDNPPPPRRKVIEVPKVRDSGSAHGISNLLFYAVGPKIVRLLLRDERAIAHGLLASSIDEGVGCRPERRTRVLNRLQAELGLISSHSIKRGHPATIKITDVELAKMWLAEVEGSA